MKKFYALFVVTLTFIASINAQEFTWTGAVNSDWNNSGNWSVSSGGPAFPNGADDHVTINVNAAINLNLNVTLASITVTGANTDVTIAGTAGSITSLTLLSSSLSDPAIDISASAVLHIVGDNDTEFHLTMGDNAQGSISGTLSLERVGTNGFGALLFPETMNVTVHLIVNSGGSIVVEANGTSPVTFFPEHLSFANGSTFHIKRDGGIIPLGRFYASSTILITGFQSESLSFEQTDSIGNLTYNCSAQVNNNIKLLLPHGMEVRGDVNILNTNNRSIILMSSIISGLQTLWEVTLRKNLNIQGNSHVIVASSQDVNQEHRLRIEGNLVVDGSVFDLQQGSPANPGPTTIYVKGNIQHTSGTFTASSSQTSQSVNLYVLELNGSAAQSISSTGIIDNGNHQLCLRINNSNGVSLSAPLTVGRLSFNSASKGKVATSNHTLTIADPVNHALVIEGYNDQGYVNGNLRRLTNQTTRLHFPVGDASNYRPVSLLPSQATASDYTVNFINNNTAPGTSRITPLSGIAPYHWNITRASGSDAVVELNIPGAIPGGDEDDGLVVARHNGTSWASVRGSTGNFLPGNSTSGMIYSELQTNFSPYTIGVALQTALPIRLVSFQARKAETSARIRWEIAEGSNPLHFELLRSSDGKNFSKLADVPVIEGKLVYDFVDQSLLEGHNYYRLKMLDKDNITSYSNIIVVMNGTEGVLISSIMPSIVTDRARLNVSSSRKGTLQLVISDLSGRTMQTQRYNIEAGNQEIWISAYGLPAGVFHITGYINNERSKTIRFFKR